MEFDFEVSTDSFLIGICNTDGIAEDFESGEISECKILQIGFLLFTLNFNFLPRGVREE